MVEKKNEPVSSLDPCSQVSCFTMAVSGTFLPFKRSVVISRLIKHRFGQLILQGFPNPDYEEIMDAMEALYEPMGKHGGGIFNLNVLDKREPSFSLGNFYGQP